MKRAIVGAVAALGLSILTLGAPTAGASTSTRAVGQTHAQVVQCAHVVKNHGKVTRAVLANCRGATFHAKCIDGHEFLVVNVDNVNYGLRQGRKPIKIGNAKKLALLAGQCPTSPAPIVIPQGTTTHPATTTAPTTTTTHPPPPATTTTAAPPPTTAPPPPPTTSAPAGCHPTTAGGNCYSAGELCSDADHGLSGVAGNGEAITCEDNNGWRWEPA